MLNVHKRLYEVKERLYNAGQFSKIDLGDEAIATIELEQEIENTRIHYQDALAKIFQSSYVPIDKDTELLPLVVEKDIIEKTSFIQTPQAQQLQKKIKQKKMKLLCIKDHNFQELGYIVIIIFMHQIQLSMTQLWHI